MPESLRFLVPATDLASARRLSHAAVQWSSKAARANLPARDDDSHSNLGWHDDLAALLSRPLDSAQRYQLGFSFRSASLLWLIDGALQDSLKLSNSGDDNTAHWCDQHLKSVGLATTDQASMPYELAAADYSGLADEAAGRALETLGAWFSQAHSALSKVIDAHGGDAITPPQLRCWPHHFDLATLFALEGGDPETARSIGIGLSPGDSSYAEPYLYCNPWPAPEILPDAPGGLQWHTEGFTSLVCTASNIDATTAFGDLAERAFATVRSAL